jgi:SAM-dependent methyltransferase
MLKFSNATISDIFEWDVLNWSKALDFWKIKNDIQNDKEVLTIGERNGGLSLLFALMGSKVTATDLNGLTEKAYTLHKNYKLQDSIKYQTADFLNLPFENNSFDIICFKSVLGALRTRENQKIAIEEAYRVLRSGGILYFAENMLASRIHQFFRKKFTNWASYWLYIDYKDVESFFIKFDSVELNYYGLIAAFGRTEKQRMLLGKVDNVLMKFIPDKFRYILFGKCLKSKV